MLETDDNRIMSIPGLTEKESQLFSIEEKGVVTQLNYDYFTRVTLQFEVSNDVRLMTRSVYTFWQVLGDVGGLNGLLISLVTLILSVASF